MSPRQKRPIGITLLALVFLWIGCGGTLIFPIIVLTGASQGLWQMVLGSWVSSELWLRVIAILLDCILFSFYVAYAFIGFGLWRLKNWARKSVLFICALEAAIGVVFVCLKPRMGAPELGGATVVFGLLVWYLMRPKVRFAFGDPKAAATLDA